MYTDEYFSDCVHKLTNMSESANEEVLPTQPAPTITGQSH